MDAHRGPFPGLLRLRHLRAGLDMRMAPEPGGGLVVGGSLLLLPIYRVTTTQDGVSKLRPLPAGVGATYLRPQPQRAKGRPQRARPQDLGYCWLQRELTGPQTLSTNLTILPPRQPVFGSPAPRLRRSSLAQALGGSRLRVTPRCYGVPRPGCSRIDHTPDAPASWPLLL